MSRRPPPAAPANARANGPSRRMLIGGATVAPLLGSEPVSETDESIAACEGWLALNAEHERLAGSWSKLEAKLNREHGFLRLSSRQRRDLPQAQELYEIDDRLEELHQQERTLLALLPTFVATTPLGLAGKLAVAAIEVCPEENEEAHHIITSVLRDLKAMMGAPAV